MPTHIDIQCGHYRDVVLWNQKAIVGRPQVLRRAPGAMNFYSVYRVHNYHFVAYGAMFLGQYEPAIAAADELIETMPEAMLRIPSPPMADFFESYLVDQAARAGPLRQMARDHRPGAAGGPRLYCNTVAMMHYAKGVAHAALGEVPRREAEQALFRRGRATRARDRGSIHNNTVRRHCWPSPRRCWTARSPIAAANIDAAFAHLRARDRAGG